MRSGPNTRRPMRRGNGGGGGGGSGGRRNGSPRSQNFDSNGPDIKVRGNAQQVVDKYQTLAREAATAGDPVMAENYYQHAEHYYRVMTANGGGENRQGGRQPDGDNGTSDQTPAENGSGAEASSHGNGNGNGNPPAGNTAAARDADAEKAAPSAAAPSVEETGEPVP